jgi:hypothetical protein
MRYLLPALALASAVALFAAVPVAGAQYGGATMPPLGPQPSGPVGPEAQLTAAPPSGPSGGTTTYTCAYGQVLPFSIPRFGFDQLGRPFFFNVEGWYGPYDGFGYPVAISTIGFYGGQPFARVTHGYIPLPCPVAGWGAQAPAGTGAQAPGGVPFGPVPTAGMLPFADSTALAGALPSAGGYGGLYGPPCYGGYYC